VTALAAGSVLLAGTVAQAADPAIVLLATGGVYGGITQNHAVCYVFNAGATATPKLIIQLRKQNGGLQGPATTLPAGVAPGTISAQAFFIANNQAYSCTVLGPAGSSAPDLRGVMDVRDVSNNVLVNSNLH
jgi:hypothetical protein